MGNSLKPLVSIVVFNKEHKSIKPLADQLLSFPANSLIRAEFVLVFFDNDISKESEKELLHLRTCMRSICVPYNKNVEDYKKYGSGTIAVLKTEDDKITFEEVDKLMKEALTIKK